MDGERAVRFDSTESILAKDPLRRGCRPRRSDLRIENNHVMKSVKDIHVIPFL